MILSTTHSQEFGHPEISIHFDENAALSVDAEWLINYLETAVKAGEVFKENSTIQIGWMINCFRTDGRTLWLYEPDFIRMPIVFVNSVNWTLAHLRLQRSVCESVGIDDMEFPALNQSGIVCNELKSATTFLLDRTQSKGADSGWFIGCADPKHDHNNPNTLQRKSLYEIISLKPKLVQYLALPPGVKILVNKTPKLWRNGKELRIIKESYLQEKYFEQ